MPHDKRKHNCSPKCAEEWRCKTSPTHLRYILEKRDRGVCAHCGIDTIALREAIHSVNGLRKRHLISEEEWRQFRNAVDVNHRWPGDLWDADHITPVVEGGGECGLDGYRTLCIPCHKKETAELARRLARKRALDKAAKKWQEFTGEAMPEGSSDPHVLHGSSTIA